jgi:hypothetical protein
MCFAFGFQQNQSGHLKKLIVDLVQVRENGHQLSVDIGSLQAAVEMKTLYSPSALMDLIKQAEQDAAKIHQKIPTKPPRLVKIYYQTNASGFVYQNNIFWEPFEIMPVYDGDGDEDGEMYLLLYGPDYAIDEWLHVCFNREYEYDIDDEITASERDHYEHYIRTAPFSTNSIYAKIDIESRCLMAALRRNWPGLWDGDDDVSGGDLVAFISAYVQGTELKRYQLSPSGNVNFLQDRRVSL